MNATILAGNLAALSAAGCPVPEDRLTGADDADVVVVQGTVVGVVLRTPDGPHPMQGAGDPVREALASLPDDVDRGGVVAIVGAGAGHVLDALEARRYGGRMLVLEPSPASCLASLARRDWSALIGQRRLRWLVGPDYEGWLDAWSWITPGEPPAIAIHPALARARPQDVRAALEVLKRLVFNASANERARRQFAGPYLLNTLANLPHLLASRDAGELIGRYQGVPAVVLAAGPSLNRNLEELAPVRDRALVIAVDTALRPCLASGIEPDFVVAVDPGVLNRRHLEVGQAPRRSVLVAEPSLAPGSFDAFEGRVVTFRVSDHEPWPWLVDCGVDRGRLSAWGSVLSTALDFAVATGASPIYLAGADFAYTGGQPYCRGTAYEEDWARDVAAGQTLQDVWKRRWHVGATVEEPGLDDVPVRSTPQLLAFRDWISAYCRTARRPVLNATGAGVLRGVPRAPLADLADRPVVTMERFAGPTAASLLDVPGALTWGLEPADTGPMRRWAAIAQVSPLELVARLSPSLSPTARASLHEAYAAWRTRDLNTCRALVPAATGRVATQARAVEIWRALHAHGYVHRHPSSFDRRHTAGLDRIRELLALRSDDLLLDVGCGDGRLLWHLAPTVKHATGVDVDDAPLDAARALLDGRADVSLVRGDGLTLAPIPPASMTAVVAFCVLQFMTRVGVADYLTEVARVLVPGGRACLQFFSDGTDEGDVLDEVREQSVSYSPAQIVGLVAAAGLRLTRLEREDLSARYPGRSLAWWWVRCERPLDET